MIEFEIKSKDGVLDLIDYAQGLMNAGDFGKAEDMLVLCEGIRLKIEDPIERTRALANLREKWGQVYNYLGERDQQVLLLKDSIRLLDSIPLEKRIPEDEAKKEETKLTLETLSRNSD